MRRIAVLLVGFFVAAGVLAPAAAATFHLNMANEVMLASGTGDSGAQFVELLDHGGSEEAFTPVFAPYKLVIYDAAGTQLGEHVLDPAGLRDAAAADREYLVSTPAADAALGVTADEALDVQLPLDAGQACFQANPDPPAFSCLTWGAISKPVATNSMGTGSVNGPAPANGKSEQRLPDQSVVTAAPTPKAPNKADSGTPGGGGGPPPFAGVGFGKHRVKVDRAGRAHVRLTCPQGSGGCSGRLTLTSAGAHGKRVGRASFGIADGRGKRVAVQLTARAQRRLARTRTLNVRGVAKAKDYAGTGKRSSAALVLVVTD
jgi:hypothetical protein